MAGAPNLWSQVRSFLAELRRRRVYRVAVVYAVVAFVVAQVGELVFPALRLPDWSLTLLVVLALLGFPIALVLAWAFEVTPEGGAVPSPWRSPGRMRARRSVPDRSVAGSSSSSSGS